MQKPLIMIVDDSETILKTTKNYLENANFDVVTRSKSIGTTLEIIKTKPDCVLLDVTMPGVTGDGLAKIIRQSNPDTNLVLFSAKEENELQALVKECGADGYIKKSGDVTDFLNKVRSYLPS